jgi:GTPase SAR1 family protein
MSDIEIIERLESELDKKFKKISLKKANSFSYYDTAGYVVNSKEEVVGININKIKLKSVNSLSLIGELKNLKVLKLHSNGITNLSFLKKLIHLEKLNLFNNKITSIEPITHLKKLTYLNLSTNELDSITGIDNLINLKSLDLSSNESIDLSDFKEKDIIKKYDLIGNQISDISALKSLSNLRKLGLSENKITNISVLEHLQELRKLDLSENQISDITSLNNLRKIEQLDLSNNSIANIEALSKKQKITLLNLDNNDITDISAIKSFLTNKNISLTYDDNPLKFPPKEIAEIGREAVIEYLNHAAQGTEILTEAKLIIIGEAGAGKTTFARKVIKPSAKIPTQKETTLGVDVHNWLPHQQNIKNFNIKLWDFGGQDIYHGTHQFFFSDRSLYVLLADTREQKTDFNYWLNTVEQLTGEDSPLIIILNKKQGHTWKIDKTGLKDRFGKIIKQIVDIDLSNSKEIPVLQDNIINQIENLPHIGYILPTSWVKIRQKLKNTDKNFISYEHFRKICKEEKISNPKVLEIISKLFTNIGVFTHFLGDSTSLQDIIFLNSNWLTKTVYLLLNDSRVKIKKGRISLDDIKDIWKDDEIYFDTHKFIELLKKFSLIYQIENSKNYIIPEHLPEEQPYKKWKFIKEESIYQFRYQFDNYMPKGIMPKLIVALHNYIYDSHLVWSRGVNISDSKANPTTYAEIKETYGRENRFDIKIYGQNPKDLLQLIMHHFDSILKPFQKLSHEKLVPCNCDRCRTNSLPHFYNYSELLKRQKRKKETIECQKDPYYDVNVNELIEGINLTELKSLLINEKYEEFEISISRKFSNISYQIHKEKVDEGYFHSIFQTILHENGLIPVSEESTNKGRIDLHLTIGQIKYLFEFKINKTAEEAITQIKEKKYYEKFLDFFNKQIVLVGINFNTKTRNIDGIKAERIENSISV